MEWKTDALLLRSTDFGENDKIVTLLTSDRGKIGASLKGVKKAGAKLRFAAQPFCFAEYVLAEKNGRYTIISASLHDGFFSLGEDILRFYAGCSVCEICDRLVYEGMDGGELLICAVKALRSISLEDPSCALIAFLLGALKIAGYPVQIGKCFFCGKPLSAQEHLRFDFESGAFLCRQCGKGANVSGVTYQAVCNALTESGSVEKEGQKRALRLLSSFLIYHTESELLALPEYIKLL